jgi:ribosomal protein S18 acetylase RimI-like enzyme
MPVYVEKAGEKEISVIVALIREFAEFENLSEFCEVTEENLKDAMFGENAFVEGLITFDGETPIGYALFYPNFASFRGQKGLYLEDIYIKQEYRGKGVGEMMLKHLARIAKERGCERIDFQVLDWNMPAIRFYEKLGAKRDEEERHFKFTDEAFKNLAS